MATTHRKQDIKDLSREELAAVVQELGQPAFRTKQLISWLYEKHAHSFDEMTNLPKALREALGERYELFIPREAAKQVSRDGSRKYLLQFSDGVTVETVGMPRKNKLAVCISTQAGCAMGCVFCATGNAGFARSLTAGEMYDQVMHVAEDFGTRPTSVVFMGQGEPFANYDATLAALRWLNASDGAGIGARHLTVSTCGVIPGIRKFALEPEQFTLAVSLHSVVQPIRNKIMPGVRKYTLPRLREAMDYYIEKTGRRPTYEYALMSGINDNRPDIDELIAFCEGTLAHVNLIQMNRIDGSLIEPSTQEKADEIVRRLQAHGIEATIRQSRGNDIDAACGQLKQRVLTKAQKAQLGRDEQA